MTIAPLGELCEINVGRTPSRSDPSMWGQGSPWLSIADMNQGLVVRDTKEQITPLGASKGRLVSEGTVLLSFKLSIGKVAVAGMPLYTNEAIAALPVRDPSVLDERFLMRALESMDLADGANRAAMGGTLNKAKLSQIEVPLPPLDEQRRIAAILDHADALRAKRRQVLAHLEGLAISIFDDMFVGHWERATLGEVAKTASGGTPSRSQGRYFGGDIPWVKSGELHSGLVTTTEESLTEEGLLSSAAKVFPSGTVLLAMYGATAGIVGQLGIEAAINQAVCAISPGPEVETEYLIAALRSKSNALLARRSGGAQPNLSQATVRLLEIDIPPLDLQRAFGASVRQLNQQRAVHFSAMRALDELFASLQSGAFKGEL